MPANADTLNSNTRRGCKRQSLSWCNTSRATLSRKKGGSSTLDNHTSTRSTAACLATPTLLAKATLPFLTTGGGVASATATCRPLLPSVQWPDALCCHVHGKLTVRQQQGSVPKPGTDSSHGAVDSRRSHDSTESAGRSQGSTRSPHESHVTIDM